MTKKRLVGLALATIFALAGDQAWAGHHWGSCGSSGGSYGSCGSSGGSYGSCGSSGGSYGSHGSSGGSWGSHGSSGGSWGSHGSSGGSYGSHGSSGGSYGSHGSSGGSYGSSGSSGGSYGSYGSAAGDGVRYYSYAGAGYAGQVGTPLGPPQAAVQRDSRVRFALTVPEDATVYLVNQPMTVTGTVRHFVTPELPQGKEYRYPIRVEVVRNGTTFAANSEVRVRAGDDINLAFAVQDKNPSQVVAARGN